MNSASDILNQWGGAFLSFAGAMLWQSSLLVLVLLVLDFGLRHRVRASVRHGLWLVLLVKLVLPTSLAAPTSPAWWWSRLAPVPLPAPQIPSANFNITHEDLPMPEVLLPQVAEPVPVRPALTPAAWSLLAASAVSLALLGWLLLRWRQVVHLSRAAIPSAGLNLQLGEARELAKFDSSVPVKLTHDTMSPAVCGLFRPVILLPHSLAETLTPDQLRAVLLHELMHVRRGDVWVNFAQSLLQIAYWWHPLVWLANARLRRIREEAVDDAVMVALRADAEIYAPTLLAVAKFALQRPLASLGLVGILESRSALRQRIERLVNLPVPRRAGLGGLSALAIVTFSAVALPMGEAPPLPPPTASEVAPSSSKAIPWSAPGYIPAAMNSASITDGQSQVGTLVQDGMVLYEMGKLDEAQTKFNQALAMDPDNAAAKYYLDLIKKPRQALSTPDRQAILQKLESIRLDTVSFDRLPLSEVLRRISEEAKIRDSEKKGVNFLINPQSDLFGNVDPATGLPPAAAATAPSEQVDVGSTIIKLTLTDVRLADVLDAIVLVADRPIQYSIQDYAVVFSPKSAESEPLFTRTFKINVDALKHGLGLVGPVDTLAGKSPSESLFQHLREYFSAHSINLNPPKAMFYKDRLGLLFIKATESDLEKVENAIILLNQSPQTSGGAEKLSEPEVPANTGRQTQMRMSNMTVNHVTSEGLNFNQTVAATNAGILSNPKFQAALHAMEQRSGVEKLAEPEITTTSGHSENRVDLPNVWVNLPAAPATTNASLTASPPMNLIDRSYEVDPEVLAASLQQALGQSTPLATDDLVPALQRLFGRSGVTPEAPKFTIYKKVNSRQVTLVVKATSEDLATIEKLFQICLTNLQPQLHLKSRFIEIANDDLRFLPTVTNLQTKPNLVGILTPGAAAILLVQLRHLSGVTVLAEPEVTTTSGRQTQMRVTQVMTVIDGINPQALTPPGLSSIDGTNLLNVFNLTKREFGPVFDVIPRVMSDGFVVNLQIKASSDVYAGSFPQTNGPGVRNVIIYVNGVPEQSPLPLMPATVMERQFMAHANLYDGQTLLLSHPFDPRTLEPVEKPGQKSKHLLVLVTATIVDPAGNRVHADDDLPFAQDHVPPAYDASEPPIVDPIILR